MEEREEPPPTPSTSPPTPPPPLPVPLGLGEPRGVCVLAFQPAVGLEVEEGVSVCCGGVGEREEEAEGEEEGETGMVRDAVGWEEEDPVGGEETDSVGVAVNVGNPGGDNVGEAVRALAE